MPALNAVKLSDNGHVLNTHWNNGSIIRFHAFWLRDNALDKQTRSPENGQRLITLSDIPTDTKIDTVKMHDNRVRISFSPEQKTVEFPAQWLLDNQYDRSTENKTGWISDLIETWDSTFQDKIPLGSFGTMREGSSVAMMPQAEPMT